MYFNPKILFIRLHAYLGVRCLIYTYSHLLIYLWPHRAIYGILVPRPGIEPEPWAVKAES